jgi:hypothetical protein
MTAIRTEKHAPAPEHVESPKYAEEAMEIIKTKGTHGLDEWMDEKIKKEGSEDKKRVFWEGFAWGLGIALVIVFFWKVR